MFDQNISLFELEEMLPYERTTYLILIDQRIEEKNQEQSNKGR